MIALLFLGFFMVICPLIARPVPIPKAEPFLQDLIGGIFDDGQDQSADFSLPTVSPGAIVNFTRFANFARASFCSAPIIQDWKCGEACDASPTTQVLVAHGDDGLTPGFFVAYDPPTNGVVIAHQGTNPQNILSISNNLQIALVTPEEGRFPGSSSSGALVHEGFLATFERTADIILSAVNTLVKDRGATNVMITGHSLGAAIAMLDTLYLRSRLPSNVLVGSVVFGSPRVGNAEFAGFLDLSGGVIHVHNKEDPVPLLPPTILGYRHPAQEVHITQTKVVECPGAENQNCSVGSSLLENTKSAEDHSGPYFGVLMGSEFCNI